MSWLLSLQMFAMNLAIAATICLAIPLVLSRCFASLPKRYGLLLAGLIGCLIAPLAVLLGAWLSLGMLPTIEVAEVEPVPAIAGVSEPEVPTVAVEKSEPDVMGGPNGVIKLDPSLAPPPLPMPSKLPAHSVVDAGVEVSQAGEENAAEDVAGETGAAVPWLSIVGFSLAGVWLLGSLIVLLRHLRSWLLCRAFVRSCREVEADELRTLVVRQCEQLGIHTQIRLLESSSLPAPVVVGWLRPAIVLPEEIAFDLSASQLRRVVAHELAHIQRRDHWISGAQVAASMLYWWNPLLSLVSWRMNELREMICDDIATSLDVQDTTQAERTDYAESLVKLAQRAIEREAMAGSLGISLSSFTEMERRVRRILTERTGAVELRITRRFMAGLSALGFLLAVGLAFAQVPGEEKEVAGKEEASQAEVADESADKKTEKPDQKLGTLLGRVVDPIGQPAEGIEVEVTLPSNDAVWKKASDATGAFQLEVPMGKHYMHQIIARSPDGKLMGIYRYMTNDLTAEDVREVTLEPIKNARVQVVDGEGKPVVGAKVAAQLAFPNSVGPFFTDEAGEAIVEIPESDSIVAVVAWKDHLGLDYMSYVLPYNQEVDQLAKKPEFPYGEGETLTLGGASPLTVHVTDTDGQPLEDVPTYVWLLKNKKNEEQLNVSMLANRLIAKTDAAGKVTFDWFPAWQKSTVTIWPHANGYAQTRGSYEPTTGKGKAEVQLARQIPLRGKVTFPDGKPASDIYVSAFGAGYSNDDFRGGGTTDEYGRYEIMATPDQIYMLTIHGKEWAAPSQSGFAVLPGEEVEEHDFVVRPATHVYGQVVNQADGKPLAGEHVYFQELGVDLLTLGNDVLPNPKQFTRHVQPILQLNETSDENGAFEFYVGDGDFRLFTYGSGQESVKFQIEGEKEKKVDLKLKVVKKSRLTGKVVDDKTGEPIPGARIQAISRDFSVHNDWQANANEEGEFHVERVGEPSYLMATSVTVANPNGKLAVISEIGADQTSVTLRLKEMGRATGRLMTEDGTKPAPHVKMYYGYSVRSIDGQMSSTRFGGRLTTDAEGHFTLENLVPGYEYECILDDHPGGYILNVAKATVEPGQTLDLGDCKIPKAPEPYTPPTLEEQIQGAFDIPKTPLERLASGKRNIATVNQNLLILFAEPLDPRVKELMKIRFEDEDYRAISDDFRFLACPTDAERIEAAQTLAKELDLPALKEKEELLLVVINHEGNLAAKIDASQIGDGDKISKAKLLNQLEKYQTTPLDARKLLDDALAQAKREDKRVLVQETATWCGPCHRLSHLLLDHPAWQKDYVWVKMDHRWTGAQEIMKEMRGEASGGIPWFAILDDEGNTLATSNEPDEGRNIGYPSEDWGQKHFAEMLTSTRQRMTDEEITELVDGAK